MSTPTVEQEPYIWKEGTKYDIEYGYFVSKKYFNETMHQVYMTCEVSINLVKKEYFIDFIDDWYRIKHPHIIPLEDAWHSTKKSNMGWVTKDYVKLFDKYPEITNISKKLKRKWCAQLLSALKYVNSINNWEAQNLCGDFIYLDTADNIKLGGLVIFYKGIYKNISDIDFTISKRLLQYTNKTYIWLWAYITIGIIANKFCYSKQRKKDTMLSIGSGILPEEVESVTDLIIKDFLKRCLLYTFEPDMEEVYQIFGI